MDTTIQVSISLESALEAGVAALNRARALGVKVAVAIVDASGIAVVQLRMPGTPLHSGQIAFDKAYTAVSFGRDTGDWKERLANRSESVRVGLMKQPHFLSMAGEVVIRVDGEKIGAIGISGASEEVDEDCARSGLQAILVGESAQ